MNSLKRTDRPPLVEGDALRHVSPVSLAVNDHCAPASTPLVTYHCPHYRAGHVVAMHRHLRAQLLYAVSGIMTVVTERGTWTVPPQQAVWIPPDTGHEVHMPSAVSMRSLYIHPEVVESLPDACQVVEVTPLLRELIARLVSPLHCQAQQVSRLMAVLIDEIRSLTPPPLHLPSPRDPRLLAITDALLANPADDRNLVAWSRHIGASERTVARLFAKETGMGFRTWRQTLRMLSALQRLAAGEDVTHVAFDLGYQSPSAFIAMFKRLLGTTPGRYIRQRKSSN